MNLFIRFPVSPSPFHEPPSVPCQCKQSTAIQEKERTLQNYSKSVKFNQKTFKATHKATNSIQNRHLFARFHYTIHKTYAYIKKTKTSFQSVALLLSVLAHYSRHIICSSYHFCSCSLVSLNCIFNSDAYCSIKAISCSARGSLCSK